MVVPVGPHEVLFAHFGLHLLGEVVPQDQHWPVTRQSFGLNRVAGLGCGCLCVGSRLRGGSLYDEPLVQKLVHCFLRVKVIVFHRDLIFVFSPFKAQTALQLSFSLLLEDVPAADVARDDRIRGDVFRASKLAVSIAPDDILRGMSPQLPALIRIVDAA